MTGQDAVKAWAMCSRRTSCTSDRGLTCDFHVIITQVALRMQLSHLLHRYMQIRLRWLQSQTLAFTVAEVALLCPSYLLLWFCENVSCADLSRLLPWGGGSLRGHRTGAGAGLLPPPAAAGDDFVCVSPPPVHIPDYHIVWLHLPAEPPRSWNNLASVSLMRRGSAQ